MADEELPELPYENKTLYSDEKPLSIEDGEKCPICQDKLLDNLTILNNNYVWNMGTERTIYDNDENELGNEKRDVIVMMYCCGKGFHRRCILKWLDTNDKCPLCNTDLASWLDENKAVFRSAKVVKSKNIKFKKVTAIKLKVLKF